ncbi:TonB-dependent receptor plug domain-containing protein [Aurantiacibacter flavus]|uniref:TonB-dependent receptor n=1 Tax=Aurantiacibacter flavus TaxID=3145232 RepID=A0ABV0D312_9SPHN
MRHTNHTSMSSQRGRSALLAGAAMALMPMGAAHAQSADEGAQEAEPEVIVVTGSRIRGVAPVGSNLIQMGPADIAKSGATTVSDVLRQVPQVTSLSINAEGATGAGASSNITRATGPNLRGLGSTATLVVFDGLRVPVAGTQGNFVDPSFVPSLALQRIEVIADGASAIYGSDAVAGVINLIPRKNFDGVEVSGQAGFADSYSEYRIGGIAGSSWGSGNIVLAADYVHNDALLGTDRDFISSDRRRGGGADARSVACQRATITSGGVTYAVPEGATGVLDFNDLEAGTVNRCDLAKTGFLIPEQDRVSVYGSLQQSLGDVIGVFAQGFYTRREFSGRGSVSAVNNVVVPTSNTFYPTNAPATPISVSTNFSDGAGERGTQGLSKSFLINAGLRANLKAWEVTLAGSYGESYDEEKRDPTLSASALSALLADSDPATAINPFGTTPFDPARADAIYVDTFNPTATNRLKSIALDANGPLFSLPGGEARMALGGEYRQERQFGAFTFGRVSAPISLPTDIDRDVKAVFAEVFVPIVGADNASPGLASLDLVAAVRHEDYSDFGSTTNPKVGLNYSPMDGVVLRGSYGTSFRAPGLAEVNANSSGAGIRTQSLTVPGNPVPRTFAVLAAGNPDLEPETATTWSAGIDITPPDVPSLRLSATYFDVTYEAQVLDVYTILPQVLAEPQNFSDILTFNDGSANWQEAVSWLSGTQYYDPGSINFSALDGIIDARKANLGNTLANGMDFEVGYSFYAGQNDFSLAANATVFFSYKNATGSGELIDRLGTYGYPNDFRARAMFGWDRGPIATRTTVNYLGAYQNMTSALVRDVSSYLTVDFDFSYSFGDTGSLADGVKLGVNIRNLFDRDPPFVDAGLGYDPSSASALGRVVSFSLAKAF